MRLPPEPAFRAASTTVLTSRHTGAVTAIVGGLGAAILWALATLVSSRSSRLIGSRVVLAWVMIVGVAVGLPVGIVSGTPTDIPPGVPFLLLLAGLCYAAGLSVTYAALAIGKVGIVAPIVATEGAVAALIAVVLGDPLGASAGALLGVIALGIVLSSLDRPGPTVPAGDIAIGVDDGPLVRGSQPDESRATRRAALLAVAAALIFGVGLVAGGKAAVLVPPIWVALAARLIGLIVVVLPLVLQRRLRLTRQTLPLVIVAGIGEIFGSAMSAWGATQSIAVAAILGSQFAAIAAVAAYVFFHERLARIQVIGVVLVVAGVSALAAVTSA